MTPNNRGASVATSDSKSRESKELHTALQQRPGALHFAASGTPLDAEGTTKAPAPPSASKLKLVDAAVIGQQAQQRPPPTTCQQCLTLNFFFDGTGNNIDADVGTMQHSNVAKLFQSRLEDDEAVGRFSFYVYGLGTYFREIGDPGNTSRGKGMGHMGQARLDWAFERFDEQVKKAKARAQNPTNKILKIRVNVFGFSRGATAARAFVRDLALRCDPAGVGHVLKAGKYPIEVSFLGLFDSVASVGMPMSANNTPGATTAGWYELPSTLRVRAGSTSIGVPRIAFGEPGADPAPGDFNGHASWADGLIVPNLVKRCVHMVAGHEFRNSFPADSVLNGRRYPAGTSEMVFPGAHSDVGGGYQPGEGARSAKPGDMLSLVPLRVMHAEARAAGVPLRSLDVIASGNVSREKSSFALDDDGAKAFAEVLDGFQHYMRLSGSGGRDVGQELLAHMHVFYRWRFHAIRRNQARAKQGLPHRDGAIAAERESSFAAERKRIKTEVDALDEKWQADKIALHKTEERLRGAQLQRARYGVPIDPAMQSDVAAKRAAEGTSRDRHLARKAQLDTYADNSTLGTTMATYDARLMADAQAIIEHQKRNPMLRLRPHYANLVSAYEDEFVRGSGLRDEKVIAFFDSYVHDSLAGFARDSTLPSDPRVLYVGGDDKLHFAGVLDPQSSDSRAA